MVTKKQINKVLDNILTKHGKFYQNLCHTLKEITDNEEEYKTLRDDIWNFRDETKDLTHEQLIIKSTTGDSRENRNGDSGGVKYTEEMQDFMDYENLLYSMHNHPSFNNGTCFISYADITSRTTYEEKYQITISDDGLMISKENDFLSLTDTVDAYKSVHKEMNNNFDEKYKEECKQLKEKHSDWMVESSADGQDYKNEMTKMYGGYVSENINHYVDRLNDELHKRNVPLDVYYIPKH